MADATETKAELPATETAVVAAPEAIVEAPAAVEPEAAPASVTPAPVTIAAAPKAARKPRTAAKPVKAAMVKAAAEAARKPAPAKKAAAPRKAAKPAAARKAAPAKAAAGKTTEAQHSTISQLKDTIMAKTHAADFTAKIQGTFAEAQEKAKAAYEQGTAALGEYTEFAKGNVEAVVESGKILAAGVKDLGTELVAEGRTAIETLTADAKELAAVKSPTDLMKLQGDLMRRNFDSAMAFGSKNTEAMLKLAGAAFAPLSNRVSLAVEKLGKAA